jgi:hypothetical protein
MNCDRLANNFPGYDVFDFIGSTHSRMLSWSAPGGLTTIHPAKSKNKSLCLSSAFPAFSAVKLT